jgi:hypothetical protein
MVKLFCKAIAYLCLAIDMVLGFILIQLPPYGPYGNYVPPGEAGGALLQIPIAIVMCLIGWVGFKLYDKAK